MRRSSPTSLPGTKRPTADAGTSHGFTTSGDAFILIDRFCRSFVVRASGTVIRCRLGAPMMVDLKEFGFGRCPRGRDASAYAMPVASRASGEEEAWMPTGSTPRMVDLKELDSERCPRGRRGSPAKGVSGQKPDRGFESLSLRHSIVDASAATTDNSRLALCSNAPVAQLDRVPGYELGGREFESLRARHSTRSRRIFPSASSFPELDRAMRVR